MSVSSVSNSCKAILLKTANLPIAKEWEKMDGLKLSKRKDKRTDGWAKGRTAGWTDRWRPKTRRKSEVSTDDEALPRTAVTTKGNGKQLDEADRNRDKQ